MTRPSMQSVHPYGALSKRVILISLDAMGPAIVLAGTIFVLKTKCICAS